MTRPCLRIVGLHVEGLKSIRRLDWPADGLGWNGRVPDMVMVGGVNGSGKTTLLNWIVEMSRLLTRSIGLLREPIDLLRKATGWADVEIGGSNDALIHVRLLVGDQAFVQRHQRDGAAAALTREELGMSFKSSPALDPLELPLNEPSRFAQSTFPSVVYLPTDRALVLPKEDFKAAGKLKDDPRFLYVFQRAEKWNQSIEALLYSARWADLNAKEAGHPEQATHFAHYAEAFRTFFEGAKELVWTPSGDLVVEVKDTRQQHGLAELSSGEKQVIVLAAELLRRWRPGSLILIDEPELHLHPTWQTKLWSMLTQWQKERGGQVIVATQSNHLFMIAEPGTKVLLGGSAL